MASEPLDLDALLAHAEDHRSPHMTVSRDTIRALIARLRAAEAALRLAQLFWSEGDLAKRRALWRELTGEPMSFDTTMAAIDRTLAAAPAEEPEKTAAEVAEEWRKEREEDWEEPH